MYKGMIVDDAAVMRMRLRDILGPHFEIVSEAVNGVDGLANFKIHNPDFVTLDIAMPKMDGIETLKKMIQHNSEARIVIVSAIGQKKQVFEALSLGAKDFIVKPFEADKVLSTIFKLLGMG